MSKAKSGAIQFAGYVAKVSFDKDQEATVVLKVGAIFKPCMNKLSDLNGKIIVVQAQEQEGE